MIYLLYFLAALATLLTQALYYNESWRNSPNFYWWGLSLNVAMLLCWLRLVRIFGDKQHIYLGAIYWDIMYFVIGYGMPLLIFGVKLNWLSALGVIFVLVGATIVHINFPH